MSSKFLIGLSVALAILRFGPTTPPAWAHAYPAVSLPNNGATVKESPREVRIQFTEAVEMAFSAITVIGANKEVVSQGKLRKAIQMTRVLHAKSRRRVPVANLAAKVDAKVLVGRPGWEHITLERQRLARRNLLNQRL
jgi:methionine-rich copper-binding protein CopC